MRIMLKVVFQLIYRARAAATIIIITTTTPQNNLNLMP
jgi:hypothetical protein